METVYASGDMVVSRLVVGPLHTNSYILYSRGSLEAIIVDPGGDYGEILSAVEELGVYVRYVIATHGHFDHVLAVPRILEHTRAKFAMHSGDEWLLEHVGDYCRIYDSSWRTPRIDLYLAEDTTLKIGSTELKILHTPGHTPGSISVVGRGFVLTGDTLFKGAVGSTRFPGGDPRALACSIVRLMRLPDDTIVLPGHGETTTIGFERRHNPFVKEILSGGCETRL